MKNRINRNLKTSIKADIKHLEEMAETLETVTTDSTSFDHLKTLIIDWKDELKATVYY